MKGVVSAKLKEGGGAYEKWVEEAKGRSRKRRQEARKQGLAVEE